ncbi:proteasome subunit beta type-4 [Manacus vitellinus]|uniref:proteasome subunit beta type-4 n=1 Tax=Manacus vitellinus TaxID=328815 RepID=UPI00115CD34C|nr:proteasome subunit beta type-4 [Manacus vitellinus]
MGGEGRQGIIIPGPGRASTTEGQGTVPTIRPGTGGEQVVENRGGSDAAGAGTGLDPSRAGKRILLFLSKLRNQGEASPFPPRLRSRSGGSGSVLGTLFLPCALRFLGYVDMLGVAYEAPTLATGFGAYLAQPLMREVLEKKQSLTQEEARDLLERCLRILYYRDARSFNRYELATVTEKGVQVEGPLTLEANWDIAHVVSGFE